MRSQLGDNLPLGSEDFDDDDELVRLVELGGDSQLAGSEQCDDYDFDDLIALDDERVEDEEEEFSQMEFDNSEPDGTERPMEVEDLSTR